MTEIIYIQRQALEELKEELETYVQGAKVRGNNNLEQYNMGKVSLINTLLEMHDEGAFRRPLEKG